jgi:hypothetical protein
MDTILPPVTRGESLNVLSWTLLCLTILSKVARFGSKYVIVRKFEWDDLMASFALVCRLFTPQYRTAQLILSKVVQCWANDCSVDGDGAWAWLSPVYSEQF